MAECSQANRPLGFPQDKPLAMAYVPWQHLTETFDDLDEAYEKGTIFPELCKPFSGRRNVK